jgi:hypothetical protein
VLSPAANTTIRLTLVGRLRPRSRRAGDAPTHPKGSAMGKGNKTRKKEVKKPKQDKKSAPAKK